MNRTLMAAAVATALALPSIAAAQSSVEIYGRANLGIDSWEADGATAPGGNFDRRLRVFDGSSRIGFRINEALGGGMRAFAVIETGINIDTGSQAGQSGEVAPSTGFWASRDSYLGLGGGWGDVRFGRQSIWWANGVIAQTGANYINNAVDGLINDPGLVAIPVARQSSVVSYNSATFGGFNASVSFSPHDQEAASFTTETATAEKGSIFGVTGRYTSGALRAQLDWAQRSNVSNVADRNNTGLKVGLGWAYAPGSQISGIFGRLENENVAAVGGYTAGGEDLEQTFWLLNWEHMLGQWQILAQYYNSGEVKGLASEDDTGTTGITLAAKYYLSKRTGVYASFSSVRNDARAFADISAGGTGSSAGAGGLPASSAGADPRVIAVGVMHNF